MRVPNPVLYARYFYANFILLYAIHIHDKYSPDGLDRRTTYKTFPGLDVVTPNRNIHITTTTRKHTQNTAQQMIPMFLERVGNFCYVYFPIWIMPPVDAHLYIQYMHLAVSSCSPGICLCFLKYVMLLLHIYIYICPSPRPPPRKPLPWRCPFPVRPHQTNDLKLTRVLGYPPRARARSPLLVATRRAHVAVV